MQIHLHGLNSTQAFADALVAVLRPGDVVGLSGDLGCGKTTLVRFFVLDFSGLPELVVTSPTFTLFNRYEVSPTGFLNHIDLYRLGGYDEFLDAGIEEFLFGGDSISFIEWFDRIIDEVDFDYFHIHFTAPGPDHRVVSIDGDAGANALLIKRLKEVHP